MHLAEELQRARRRVAHVRSPGDRFRSQHRPDPRELHLDDRHCRAEHDDHRAAERPDERDRRELLLQLDRGRLDASSATSTPAAGRPAPARRATPGSPTARTPSTSAQRTRPGTRTRLRRASRGPSTPPRRTRRSPPSRTTRRTSTGASFSFSSSEGGSTLRVQPRLRRLDRLHLPEELHRARRRLAHVRTSARPTRPGTPTRPRRASRGRSTPTAPNTTITAQPNDPTNATGASFSFSSSEGGSSFECNLDSGGWTACTSPKSYTGLAEGAHTFAVRATDTAGNTDATPASFTWTVDTTAPNTTITAQPSDPTNSTAPSFSFTSSEGGSTLRVPPRRRRLDGLHLAEELQRPRAGRAHIRRAFDRCCRQHRRHARELHLDDRHDRAVERRRLPRRRLDLQRGRLERSGGHGLRLGRLGARSRRGVRAADVDGPLLGRLVVRERLRAVAGRVRHRDVVACVRERELRGGRRLRRPRARSRYRRQRRGTRLVLVHVRHGLAADHDRLRAERSFGLGRRELLVLVERARLELRVPPRRRRLDGLRQPEELHRAQRRRAHVRRSLERRRRQRRSFARELRLDDRHRRS